MECVTTDTPMGGPDARVERAFAFLQRFFGDTPPGAATVDLGAPMGAPAHASLRTLSQGARAFPRAPYVSRHLVVDPVRAIAAETADTLRRARHSHMPLVINAELHTQITNTVHGTNLVDVRTGTHARLPLNEIVRALYFLSSQYNTERFAKLVQRYGPSVRLTQLIFATGNIVETGRVSFEGKRAQMHALIDLIHAAGYPHVGIGRRVCQNIVSTGRLTFHLRLWLLRLRFDGLVRYNPDEFAGAVVRHPELRSLIDEEEEAPEESAARPSANPHEGYVYAPVDSLADERLEDPDAMRAASEYAHHVMSESRVGGHVTEEEIARVVDEQMSRQKKKNIVVLAFEVGVIICCGAKNVRMLRRAYAIVFEMLTHCRDTPENRVLEARLMAERGIVAGAPAPTAAPTLSSDSPMAAPVPKRRGRKPGARKGLATAPMGGQGVVKPRRGRKPKPTQ
jgi:TATA-box binding protein (TBP) (component of TFIID and TFIIIB)